MLVMYFYGTHHSLTMTDGRIWNYQCYLDQVTLHLGACLIMNACTVPSGPVHCIVVKTKI